MDKMWEVWVICCYGCLSLKCVYASICLEASRMLRGWGSLLPGLPSWVQSPAGKEQTFSCRPLTSKCIRYMWVWPSHAHTVDKYTLNLFAISEKHTTENLVVSNQQHLVSLLLVKAKQLWFLHPGPHSSWVCTLSLYAFSGDLVLVICLF